MTLRNHSLQHPEIGSFALRLLWIPIVGSILIVGFLGLRTPQDERASTMAVATTRDHAPSVTVVSPPESSARQIEAVPAMPDEAVAAHEALDPVGAGHEVAR